MRTESQDVDLSQRIVGVQERIAASARRSGRRAEDVTLVAVSKTQAPQAVVAALAAGLRAFGENRVEEAVPKTSAVAELLQLQGTALPSPEWHMIGHIQSRKARDVLPWAKLVHSVDGEKLADRLDQYSRQSGRILAVLLEVNVSGEASKNGLPTHMLPEAVNRIGQMAGLRLAGLMTVAPVVSDPEEVRWVFAALRLQRDALARSYPHLDLSLLSMGMSDDFEVAIAEGATMVRLGRGRFGPRVK